METNKTFCCSFLVKMTQKIGTRLGRYLGMLLIPLMSMLATSAWADASGTCGDNLNWAFDEGTGTLTIKGAGAMSGYSGANQPWASYKESIKKVVFSEDCENVTIGSYAFNNFDQLESVEMSGVTTIDNGAFYGCASLTDIDLSKVTSIGNYAFQNCDGLTSVKLSECESIGESAFDECSKLESAEMPKVTSLGTLAFHSSNLKTVALPNVTTMGDGVFYKCSNLTSVDLSKLTSIGGKYVFEGCSSLTTVDLSNVTSIGEETFADCSNLKSVTNLKVTSLPGAVFQNCTSLTDIDLSDVTTIGGGVFYNCTSLADIDLSDVTTIDQMAFYSCTSLSSVDLSSVTSLGFAAFALCTSLSSVDLSSVTSIGYAAFGYCTSLKDVDLSAATSIGEMCFYECSGLESVILNGNATLGNSAFAKDTKLASIVVTPSTSAATWGDAVFDGSSLGMLIFTGSTPPSYTDDTKTLYEAISLPTSTKVFYPETYTEYATAFADQGSENLFPITPHDKVSATCDADGYAAKGWYSEEENGIYVNSATYQVDAASKYIEAATGHDFSSQTLAENGDGTYSYVCANNASHKSGVFIKDYDGNGNNLELSGTEGNYSVESLELKDGVAFSSPVDFTVNKLTYDRKATSSIITFMLPFDMDASSLNGSAYILNTFDGQTLKYSPVTELQANTPYLLKVANLNELVFEELNEVTVKATIPISVSADKATQFGSFIGERFSNDENYDYYGYVGGKFYRAKKTVVVNPFRTGIKLSFSSGLGNGKPHMSPEELDIVFEDEATGIETVPAELGLNGKVNVYDALGRAIRLNVEAEGCLDGLQNGIYIVNGKKIVVRN